MKIIGNYFLLILFVFISSNASALPDVKVTLKVVDENGMPVAGAMAAVNFQAGMDGSVEKEETDSEGMATMSGSSTRFIEYGAGKDGYYSSWYSKSYTEFTGMTGFRKWQPWNETLTVVLRKIINPRALYIGNNKGGSSVGVPIPMPNLGKEYGYDLIVNDWVIPDGSGIHKDFIFKVDDNNQGVVAKGRAFDYSLSLKFSNEGDGIQIYNADPVFGSELRLPHNAPVNGYEPVLHQRYARTDTYFTDNDFPDDRNYYFRVRTIKDDKGNIESALYGKVYGNIRFSRKNITMLYYINPDPNDRNLEADYKKNLFPSKKKYGYTEYPP